MALNFPASPAVGQLYPVPPLGGVPQYIWDGARWKAASAANTLPEAPIDDKLYARENADWERIARMTVGTMAPLEPALYDVWVDTN